MGFKSRKSDGQHFPTDEKKPSVSSDQVLEKGGKRITVVNTQKANKIKLTPSQKRMHQAVADMKNPSFVLSKNEMDFIKNSINRLSHADDRSKNPPIVQELIDASWSQGEHDGIKLDSGFQTQGFDWLKKSKQQRQMGEREKAIVKTATEIRMNGFHDNGNMHVVFNVPNFEVLSPEGSMEYHVEAGEISITG